MPFARDAQIVTKALDRHVRESLSREQPVIDQAPMADLIDRLDLAAHVGEGGLSGERLAAWVEAYLASTTRLHHPAYMAHQCAIPHYAGALGALIDGYTNNAMAIYEMGPGAASIEYYVVNWLLGKVGWQPAPLPGEDAGAGRNGAGVLTHGGSLANLTGLLAARTRIAPNVWMDGNPGDLALLAPEGAHYSVARAAGILGIGHRSIYLLEVDARGVVVPDRLPASYARLLDDGKRAVAVVANACSTAVGLYDPLREIGAFCREHDLWLHVDGAHGASALLSEAHRHRLDGSELADSLTWDAHKLMRTPTLCTALLVRDHATLDGAFQQEASYLFHEKEQPGFDFIQRTVECTKAGLGLRLFLVLAALGEQGMAAYIDRQFALATEAYAYLKAQPGFRCAVRPEANILCFRVEGSDAAQLALRDRLTAHGAFYVTSTSFNGERYLRLAFMNPTTNMDDVAGLVREIRALMEQDG